MRFLLDECLSARLTVLLTDAGHDAVHIGDVGLFGAPDDEVMRAAAADSRVLVSADTDFGELLAAGRALGPSFILFRRSRRLAKDQIAVLIANLHEFETDLDAGAVVVLTDDRIRVRRLPLR